MRVCECKEKKEPESMMHGTCDENEGVSMLLACWSSSMMCPQKPYISQCVYYNGDTTHSLTHLDMFAHPSVERKWRHQTRSAEKETTKGSMLTPDMNTPHAWVHYHRNIHYLGESGSPYDMSEDDLSKKHVPLQATCRVHNTVIIIRLLPVTALSQLSPAGEPSSPAAEKPCSSWSVNL